MKEFPIDKKIVMLAGEGDYSLWVYNYLIKKRIKIEHLIIEKPIDRNTFLRRRIKKMGVIPVVGQLMHRVLVVPILKYNSKKRVEEIKNRAEFNGALPNDKDTVVRVNSANSPECIQILKEINPYLVIVVNTRIIAKKTLSSINAQFINIHAGITPKYRGWHGAYWALVNNDRENCGITIHLVDEGVDTGGILYQANIEVTKIDNYYTYPFLQLEQGLPILQKAILDIMEGEAQNRVKKTNLPDGLFSHPTIWEYLWNRAIKKVK